MGVLWGPWGIRWVLKDSGDSGGILVGFWGTLWILGILGHSGDSGEF